MQRFGDSLRRLLSLLRRQEQHPGSPGRLWFWIEETVRDLRYGARALRRSRGFTLLTTLTLALGIGANAAIFSALHAIWLAPVPYPPRDRLMDLKMKELTGNRFDRGVSVPDLDDWKAQSSTFDAFGTHAYDHQVNVTAGGEAEELTTHAVSSTLFPTLGVAPQLGRGFSREEDLASGPRAVLLSHGYWMRRFGGQPAALGQSVTVDGQPHTIVGVMPPGFEFPTTAAEWSPALWRSLHLAADRAGARNYRSLSVVARLKPGVSPARAQQELQQIVVRLSTAYPRENGGLGVQVTPLNETRAFTAARPTLLLLMGAAAFVLLIACVNVANLLVTRAAGRDREFAVRRALGVSGSRLVRQLLTETCLLALAGGAAGVGLAYLSLPALKALMPANMPRVQSIRIDGVVLAFTTAISLLTGFVFGLAPAWHAVRRQSLVISRAAPRPRSARFLVAAEVALSLVLLAAAGLLMESFRRASIVDFGFDRDRLLTMKVELTRGRYNTGQRVEAFREELLRQASALPGVVSAGTVSTLPLGHLAGKVNFEIEGREVSADYAAVSPAYLQAMRIPLLRGRYFADNDRAGTPPVLVVSQSAERRFWGDAPGKRIEIDGISFTIVGVVKDVRQYKPEEEPRPQIYVLTRQLPEQDQAAVNGRYMVLVLRLAGPPTPAIPAAIRAAVARMDRDLPVADVRMMDEWIARSLEGRRLNMLLLAIFAACALLLAAVGIFAVVASSVARRTSEIGIRMALGAHPLAVLTMVTRETLLLGLAGVAAGLAATLAASRLLSGFIYGVRPAEPFIVIGVAALLLIVVAAAATSRPAAPCASIR